MPLASGACPSERLPLGGCGGVLKDAEGRIIPGEQHRAVGVDHVSSHQLPAHEGLAGPGGVGGQHPGLPVGLLEGTQIGERDQIQEEVDGIGGGGAVRAEENGLAVISGPVHGDPGHTGVNHIVLQRRHVAVHVRLEDAGGLALPPLRRLVAGAGRHHRAVHVVEVHPDLLHHGPLGLGDGKLQHGGLAVELDNAVHIGGGVAAHRGAGRQGRYGKAGQEGQTQQQGENPFLHHNRSNLLYDEKVYVPSHGNASNFMKILPSPPLAGKKRRCCNGPGPTPSPRPGARRRSVSIFCPAANPDFKASQVKENGRENRPLGGSLARFAMQKHSKIAMCRLRRHGMRSQRVGRDGPHARKLHAPRLLPVFVARLGRMKFHAQRSSGAGGLRPAIPR